MFSDQISIFETFDSVPVTIPLARWIRATMSQHKYAKQVMKYRQTGNNSFKKGLPAITAGAICEDGHREADVVSRTGWVALDIDGKENPAINNAAQLRDEIAKIRYVAFTGLSASGKGVWVLVKVANPSEQARYFDQLKADFKSRGITLDSTKGKNASDLRFYSYDPNAVINKDFTIYDRLPKIERPRTPAPVEIEHTGKYGQAALEGELNELAHAANGNRNNQLFKSAASLAELVAGGALDGSTVKRHLFDVALSTGLKEHEARATIQSGFRTGLKNPRRNN